MNLSFPDQTYSSTNKPSSATLKSDLQTVETDFNALEAAAVTLTGSQTLTNKVLTNPTINFTDKAASTNVKARAYLSADQSINSGSSTKVQFDTESYDTGSDFDNATNYRFTAPVTGYYAVSVQVVFENTTDGVAIQLDLQKNGTDFTRTHTSTSGNNYDSICISDTVLLTSSDYLEVKFTHSAGSARNISGGTGPDLTFFSVHLLSV